MPMKTPSAPVPPKPIDRPAAWACTITNLAALPGLGTIAAGRKVGYAQAALALTGFALNLVWAFLLVRDWRAEGALPTDFRPSLWLGIAGVFIFGTGWLWSLSSSLQLHRQAGKPPTLSSRPHDESRSSAPPRR